jgi:hypothetical protein
MARVINTVAVCRELGGVEGDERITCRSVKAIGIPCPYDEPIKQVRRSDVPTTI